ncbi:MAG: glycoside hydrolase family 99-like domain-containing protein [Planctomycetota bacterium]
MAGRYDVAAYVWPAYTGSEPRTRMFWPEGMGEWESVREAGGKFPGHTWPRRPLWGYVNEADPYVMEMQIAAAADHGVNVFLYDWYWYDRRPFVEHCLNDGYLRARNNDRVTFYLMWANHDVREVWDRRLSDRGGDNVIWQGGVDRAEFERLATRLVERYFTHPSYYRIEGRPVFLLYDLWNFVNGLGGVGAAREALAWFRDRAQRAGLLGLHLQLCQFPSRLNLSGVDGGTDAPAPEVVAMLGVDSVTHYQFAHITNVDRDYDAILADVFAEWDRLDRDYPVPYIPHVSIGWDNSPRFRERRGAIVRGNTPEAFAGALRKARAYVDAHPGQPPLITINSWNEWTETSYLQPDDLHGYGYLEAVREVFLDG